MRNWSLEGDDPVTYIPFDQLTKVARLSWPVKTKPSEAETTGRHFLFYGVGASYLGSLCLSFPIYKRGGPFVPHRVVAKSN